MIRRLPALLALFLAVPLLAQEPQPTPPPTAQQQATSPKTIQASIEQVKADTTLSDELRASLLATYNKALEQAKATETLIANTQQYAVEKADAPSKLQKAREELKNYSPPAPPEAAPETSTTDLEQKLATAQQAQRDKAQAVSGIEADLAARVDRRAKIALRQAELRKELEALPTQILDASLDPRLLAARQLGLAIERHKLEVEQQALEAELAAYDATTELLTTRRDLAAREAVARRTVADAWQQIVQQRRLAAARKAQEDAEKEAAAQTHDPLLEQLAAENATLAANLPALAAAQNLADKKRAEVEATIARIGKDIGDIKNWGDRYSEPIGQLLRERRAQLPADVGDQRQKARELQQYLIEAQRFALQFDRQSRAALEDESRIARELQRRDLPRESAVPRQADELLGKSRDMLSQLSNGWKEVWNKLLGVDGLNEQLKGQIDTLRNLVNERVLWIRSSAPIWKVDWPRSTAAIAWMLDPGAWFDSAGSVWSSLLTEPWLLLPLLLAMAALLMRPFLLRRLRAHADAARRGQNIAYLPTALAFADTLLLTLPLPVLLWLLAALLNGNREASDFDHAIADGANQSGWFLLTLLLIMRVVRSDGLGEAHFQWRHDGLAVLRRNLPLLLPAAFPLTFALGMLEQHANDAWLGSMGRVLLLPLLVLLLCCFWRVLHPRHGVASGLGITDKGWIRRFRGLWFVLGVGTPLALLVMTLLGYEYTAMQLARRLEYTVAVVLAGTVLHGLIARELVLERRKLSIKQMKARLAAAKSGADTAAGGGEAGGGEATDPSKLTQQTQTLLYGAISLVVVLLALQFWVDVLPALGVLRNVRLWNDDDSAITLADLLLSLLLLLATTIAARNVPGLLVLLVLQRLRIQAGERNAITTLARYSLVIVGLVASFSAIGIGWSKVQWLIAGVSVGLGFGLQEIFANFVSGLILLFERPVRVGDVVTVGNVIGRVMRIRIRATTIQDWDRKELVVPNREFVTGQFVNWTLTDPIVRLTTKVGVAYGSNTQQALQLLLQAARESKYPLRDPTPRAVFTAFGDSTLDLELRLYIDNFDDIPAMQTDVNQRIDALFQQHGIEIAFPQRDLHLRSAQPLVELLRRGDHAETP